MVNTRMEGRVDGVEKELAEMQRKQDESLEELNAVKTDLAEMKTAMAQVLQQLGNFRAGFNAANQRPRDSGGRSHNGNESRHENQDRGPWHDETQDRRDPQPNPNPERTPQPSPHISGETQTDTNEPHNPQPDPHDPQAHSNKRERLDQGHGATMIDETGQVGVFQHRRLELPLFSGDDPLGWIFRVKRYFTVNGIKEEDRMDVVVVSFEGKALTWLQWLEARKPVRVWHEFKKEVVTRFHCNRVMSIATYGIKAGHYRG